ncbi:MAG: dihydroorotate dehydrogenase electron transfer subunit [Candidatus Micrarchaeia archaeon]|jgi:dihydroorotate dehydrogenase electron transfer subunit
MAKTNITIENEGKVPFITAKITKVSEENYRIKTFETDAKIDGKPGQFVMVWVPGVGERPFSLLNANPVSLTIANVGRVSDAIHKLKVGDKLTFRGPLGNGFELETGKKAKKILLVGGGYGVVPLYWLASEAKNKKISVTMVVGARNEKDIIFTEKFKRAGANVVVATDDGTLGFKGNAVEAAKKEGMEKFDCVCSCGPEKMMYYLALACKEAKVPCQLSLERHMKCGLGICGSCDLNGFSVCRDGPVFEGEKALSFSEFGKSKRDATGKKVE